MEAFAPALAAEDAVARHNMAMEWTHGGVVYAALGDSLSIDDYAGGPGCGAASLLWRNRDRDFPAWAGRDLTSHDPGARLRSYELLAQAFELAPG